MTVLVKTLGDFLNLLVQAFNLSATFPALLFVLLTRWHVLPLLSQRWLPQTTAIPISVLFWASRFQCFGSSRSATSGELIGRSNGIRASSVRPRLV